MHKPITFNTEKQILSINTVLYIYYTNLTTTGWNAFIFTHNLFKNDNHDDNAVEDIGKECTNRRRGKRWRIDAPPSQQQVDEETLSFST